MANDYDTLLPTYVRFNKNITANAKLLWSELFYIYCKRHSSFNITLKTYANLYSVSTTAIYQWLHELMDEKLLKFELQQKTDKEVYCLLNKKNSEIGCLFCGYSEFDCLDEHHYPIRKKDGGTKTIKLCPNCHRLFHIMAGDIEKTYKISF